MLYHSVKSPPYTVVRQMAGWKTKNNSKLFHYSITESVHWKNAGTSELICSRLLNSDKIWCTSVAANWVRLRSFWAVAVTASFLLYLGTTILVPDLNLWLGEWQARCQVRAPLSCQVLRYVEFCCKCCQLIFAVVGPRASLTGRHSFPRSSATSTQTTRLVEYIVVV